jgi:exopolyphosphatase/guanosine-5'-triphosphate,3'-diphosphate pyrophosphatase
MEAVRRDIDDHLSTIAFERSAPLVGVAGTMTSLAAIDQRLSSYDPARVHGSSLGHSRLSDLFDRLAAMPLERRRVVRGLDPARADVIVAGTLIAIRLLEHAAADKVVVSDRGVRWGLAKAALAASGP